MNRDENKTSLQSHLSREQMLNYLQGKLGKAERHEVEKHLVDCDFCNDALEGLKRMEEDSRILTIADELQKLARKRKVVRKKIFTQLDLITLFALLFLILFIFFAAMLFVWKN